MSKNIRVIVAGSRSITEDQEWERIGSTVRKIFDEDVSIEYIHGGCPEGVDDLFDTWCRDRDINPTIFPYERSAGKAGGPIRNERMAKYASEGDGIGFLFVFWDGESRGTKNMIDATLKYGNLAVYLRRVNVEVVNDS